jgi:large exoprotein involved in heme utilization and adhesion
VIDASDSVVLTGRSPDNQVSALASSTYGSKDAGNLKVSTGTLTIQNGAGLTSSSFGTGKAGDITIDVGGTLNTNNGQINTAATQSTGGAITITAGSIRLRNDSDIVTSVLSGAGNGGNITLTANSIIALSDSDILAFARDGRGGNVILQTPPKKPAFFGQNYRPAPRGTDPVTLDGNNRVDVNASGAVSGNITLPDTSFIQNSLSQLPNNQIDTNKLLAQTCIVRKDQPEGTFYITGTGGIPNRPNDPALSDYPTNTIQPTTQTAQRPWKLGDPIVEPQGFYQLANGRLVMSRECP